MKKAILCAVFLTLAISFSGCSNDPLSRQTIDEIDSIGEVTLKDESLITELEQVYSEMTDKQKNQVKNYVDLRNARKELDNLKQKESDRIEQSERQERERLEESEKQEEAERQKQLSEILSTPPYSDAIVLCKALKESLYNPDSFQLNEVEYIKDVYDTYKVDYSAENKLGGTTRSNIIAQFSEGSLAHSYQDTDYEYRDREKYDFTNRESDVSQLNIEFIQEYMSLN